MYKWIILISLLLSYHVANAHQTELSSTMLIEHEENEWLLQIRSALTAFEYEVKYNYGDSAYASVEEFQELVINHIMKNISIKFNGTEVSLDDGIVKLGHETNIVFKILGTPDEIQNISVTNNSFNDISRNQSALIVFKKDFEKNQFNLNKDNNYSVDLIAKGAKFELNNPNFWSNYLPYVILSICLLIAIGLYAFFKNPTQK